MESDCLVLRSSLVVILPLNQVTIDCSPTLLQLEAEITSSGKSWSFCTFYVHQIRTFWERKIRSCPCEDTLAFVIVSVFLFLSYHLWESCHGFRFTRSKDHLNETFLFSVPGHTQWRHVCQPVILLSDCFCEEILYPAGHRAVCHRLLCAAMAS